MSDYNSNDQVYYAPYDPYQTASRPEQEKRSFIERHKWLITFGAFVGIVVFAKYVYDHSHWQFTKGPRVGEVQPGTDTSEESWVISFGGAPPLASRRPAHIYSFGRGLPTPAVYDQRLYTSETARLDRPFYMSPSDFKAAAASSIVNKGGASSLSNLNDNGSAAAVGPSAVAASLPPTMTMTPMSNIPADTAKSTTAASQYGYNFPDQASAEKCSSFASNLMAHLSAVATSGGKFDQQTFLPGYDECYKYINRVSPNTVVTATNNNSPAVVAAALAAGNK